jgi:hypothetical protein
LLRVLVRLLLMQACGHHHPAKQPAQPAARLCWRELLRLLLRVLSCKLSEAKRAVACTADAALTFEGATGWLLLCCMSLHEAVRHVPLLVLLMWVLLLLRVIPIITAGPLAACSGPSCTPLLCLKRAHACC